MNNVVIEINDQSGQVPNLRNMPQQAPLSLWFDVLFSKQIIVEQPEWMTEDTLYVPVLIPQQELPIQLRIEN